MGWPPDLWAIDGLMSLRLAGGQGDSRCTAILRFAVVEVSQSFLDSFYFQW